MCQITKKINPRARNIIMRPIIMIRTIEQTVMKTTTNCRTYSQTVYQAQIEDSSHTSHATSVTRKATMPTTVQVTPFNNNMCKRNKIRRLMNTLKKEMMMRENNTYMWMMTVMMSHRVHT